MNIFLLVTILLLCISAISLLAINKFVNKVWGLVTGILIGLIFMITLIFLKGDIKQESIDILKGVVTLPINLFIDLIIIVIPFFLFFIVASLVFSEHFGKIKKRTYGISLLNLLSLSLFGIIMAMLMIPLINLIPQDLWNFNNVIESGEEEGVWWLWIMIIVIILVSFISSLIVRFVLPNKVDSIREIVNTVVKYMGLYFSIVVFFVPVVIMCQFISIGLAEDELNSLILIQIYLGIFWLGALIIFVALFIINILLSDKEVSIKEKIKILFDQVLVVFATQSTTASLPTTQKNIQKLGVCEEISLLTPTKGVFMGMVMCNGYAPMLILEFCLASVGMLTPLNVLLVSLLVLSLAISTSGTGSADYFIITTVASIIPGLSLNVYLSVLMPAQEINERTITRPNNTLGHVYATLLTEKYHQKLSECNCKKEVDS